MAREPYTDERGQRWAPVQGETIGGSMRRRVAEGWIPWELHELAWRAYAVTYGTQQSAERIAERGGFSWSEIIAQIRGDAGEVRGAQADLLPSA